MKNIFSKSMICLLLLQTSNHTFCMKRDIGVQTVPTIFSFFERDRFTKDLHQTVKKLKYMTWITQEQKVHLKKEVLFLLKHEADINGKNKNGETPLHAYLRASHDPQNMDIEVVRLLLSNGALIDTESDNYTLMYEALLNSNLTEEIIALLGIYGFKPSAKDLRDYMHQNPNPTLEVIRYMVKHGAKINEPDESGNSSFLYYFTEENNVALDIVQYLLEKGAHINQKNRNGETVLDMALQNWDANIDIIELLIENGAECKGNPLETKAARSIPKIMRYLRAIVWIRKRIKRGLIPIPFLIYSDIIQTRQMQKKCIKKVKGIGSVSEKNEGNELRS